MALPAEFLEQLRARIALPALVGRRVRLTRAGRQWKGCCPFHGEKNPSFHVYDDHFHCFGCGAHGDAISFVMQSEGAGFTEAVSRLAAEAGLDVPQPTPQQQAAERRRLDGFAVLAEADALFRRTLGQPEGARARAYLEQRALSADTIAAFGLGYAPASRGALIATLREAGIEPQQMIDAGLAVQGEAGLRGFYADRVTFPIRDQRGRCISFGARTLADIQPKYLNGPETALFHKSRSLYGLDRAREAVRGGALLVVVEGYMDVIRLHQAGFGGAVAPLGTALGPDQLQILWQHAPAPVLCFDGDAAGGRAAARTLDVALGLAAADRSLRVAALPPGQDPDSLVQARGAPAMQAVLDAAASLDQALYDQARQSSPGDSPEARAMLHRRLTEAAGRIGDPAFARELRNALLQSFFARSRRPAAPGRAGPQPKAGAPGQGARHAPLRAGTANPAAERGRILTCILLRHPDLLHDLEEAYALVELPAPLAALRSAMRDWIATAPDSLDSTTLITHLTSIGRAGEAAQALADTPLPSGAAADAQPAEAEARWWHIFNLLDLGGLDAQVEQAVRDFAEHPTEPAERRLVALCRARGRLRSSLPEDDDGDEEGRYDER